ncbi:HAD-IA family hydrolase [Variovorax sp. VNK109]|jgi:HAD superfamily hydrolase (TIGR01549 family)|uniref:HAD-IA family hydrolase n=1 Tax=Variovorax sp. VNK109 TaxID=3400919 RepID=UPI003C0A4E46
MHNLVSHRALEEEMREYAAITFDVFDTLLVRRTSIEPVDTFYFLARSRGHSPERAEAFRSIRIRSEALRRDVKKIRHDHSEIGIHEIYEGMGSRCAGVSARDELDFETEHLQRREWIFQLYEIAKRQRKRIYAISDIYLSSQQVGKLLAINGIAVDGVYVSSESQGGKYDRKLFLQFLESEGLRPPEVMHIGDNLHADYRMAVQLGIRASHVPKAVEHLFLNSALNLGSIAAIHRSNTYFGRMHLAWLANRLDHMTFESAAQHFGAVYAAPLVFLFSRWIHEKARERGFKRVLLMTRDGHTLDAVMKHACPDLETELLFCSRRSLMLPASHLEEKPWAVFFSSDPSRTLGDVIDGMYLDRADEIRSFALDMGFDPEATSFHDMDEAERGRFLVGSRRIAADQIRREFEETRKYLLQAGVRSPQTAVVDVGWSLNSQKAIEAICGGRVNGLYLGTSRNAACHPGIESFLFDREDDAQWSHIFHHGVELLELPFLSCEQQVIAIRDGNFVLRETSVLEKERQMVAREIRNEIVAFATEAARLPWDGPEVSAALPMLRDVYATLVRTPNLFERLRLGPIPHDRSISHSKHETIADFWRPDGSLSADGDARRRNLVAEFFVQARRHGWRFAWSRALAFMITRARQVVFRVVRSS